MNKDLHQLQNRILNILIEVDKVCEILDIKYWLDSGTLLGAVRHKGFIPWDDDIDICMLREDYQKFISLAQDLLPQNLFIQTTLSDKYYFEWQIPCKIREKDTLVIDPKDIANNTFHPKSYNGIFIDIFPMDYLPAKKESYRKFKILNKFFKYKFTRITKSQIIEKILKKIFFTPIPKNFIYYIQSLMLKKYKKSNVLIYGMELPFKVRYFEYSEIFPLKKCLFENNIFPIPNNSNMYLKKVYGDNYMTPIQDRPNHFNIVNLKNENYIQK